MTIDNHINTLCQCIILGFMQAKWENRRDFCCATLQSCAAWARACCPHRLYWLSISWASKNSSLQSHRSCYWHYTEPGKKAVSMVICLLMTSILHYCDSAGWTTTHVLIYTCLISIHRFAILLAYIALARWSCGETMLNCFQHLLGLPLLTQRLQLQHCLNLPSFAW